jgi:hypothetical protein
VTSAIEAPGLVDETVIQNVYPARALDDLETIKDVLAECEKALGRLQTQTSLMSYQLGKTLTQALVDEAAERIKHERAFQARDRLAGRKSAGRIRVGASLPAWLVSVPGVDPAVVAGGQRAEISTDWAAAADDKRWPDLPTRVRAWAVNDLVRGLLDRAPENVDRVRLDDLVHAANGNEEAWRRLVGAAPTVKTLSEHRLASLTDNDQSFIRDWSRGLTAKQIAERYGISTKRVANRLGELRKEHGEELVPRRRPRT